MDRYERAKSNYEIAMLSWQNSATSIRCSAEQKAKDTARFLDALDELIAACVGLGVPLPPGVDQMRSQVLKASG